MSVSMPLPVDDAGGTMLFCVRPNAEKLARQLEGLNGQGDDIEQHLLGVIWEKWHRYDPANGTPEKFARALLAQAVRRLRRTYYRCPFLEVFPRWFNLTIPERNPDTCKSQSCRSDTSIDEVTAISATGHGDGLTQSVVITSH